MLLHRNMQTHSMLRTQTLFRSTDNRQSATGRNGFPAKTFDNVGVGEVMHVRKRSLARITRRLVPVLGSVVLITQFLPSPSAARERVMFRAGISDPVNTVLAWYMARAAGFFAAQGLEVDIVNMQGGSRGAAELQAGLVVGVLGLIVAVAARLVARRSRPSSSAPPPVAPGAGACREAGAGGPGGRPRQECVRPQGRGDWCQHVRL